MDPRFFKPHKKETIIEILTENNFFSNKQKISVYINNQPTPHPRRKNFSHRFFTNLDPSLDPNRELVPPVTPRGYA